MQPAKSNVIATHAFFLVSAALLMAGCASTANTVTAGHGTDEKKIVLSEADYDYVYVTGSTIPTRVPKTPVARPLLTSSPVKVISPEDFEAWVQRGQTAGRP